MPLYVKNGSLLNKTGTLGTSVGCCCGRPRFCTCNVTVPSSVSLEITLGSLVVTVNTPDPGCDTASVEAIVNKTYILSQVGPTTLAWSYADDETNVLFTLGCSSESGTLLMAWFVAGLQPCWNRYDLYAPYDEPYVNLSLCEFSTTAWEQSGDVIIQLNPGTFLWSQRWQITAKATAL